MLSAVGAKETASGEVDDGIRTGWVCVNVGRVEGGELKKRLEELKKPREIIGFGSEITGSRIVVQMMTEEKRGQIDLETLWNGILRRSKHKEAENQAKEGLVEDAKAKESQLSENNSADAADDGRTLYNSSGDFGNAPPFEQSRTQVRALHTTARRLQTAVVDDYTNDDGLTYSSRMGPVETSTTTLRQMLDQLQTLNDEEAIEALGTDSTDQTSTPFLSAFYTEIPSFPGSAHWHSFLELRCLAVRLGHPGYESGCLINGLTDMELACCDASEQLYLTVLGTIIHANSATSKSSSLSSETASQILAVLDKMHDRGMDAASPQVYQLLYSASSPPSYPSVQPDRITTNALISALAMNGLREAIASADWTDVWDIWASYPRRFMSRSSAQYALLLNAVAERQHQKEAMHALRTCVPTMPLESPAVLLSGEVAEAVDRCLTVAAPNAEELGENGSTGEWGILWRRLHVRSREV